MIWTAKLLAKIAKIIDDVHTGIAVSLYGKDTVDPEVYADLKNRGLLDESQMPVGKAAYLYGMALQRGDQVKGMNAEEFEQHIADNPVPLGPVERQAIALANQRGAMYVRGLGNRVNLETGAVAIEADGKLRQRMQDIIRDKTEQRIAERESLADMKSNLGWATGDWTRDLERIANTESQNAMQEGKAAQIRADNDGKDANVSKLVSPDCCNDCRRLYVGTDGKPIIFKLSQLEKNGTNVGVKRANWKPVVGATHCHCACELVDVPMGLQWNKDHELEPIPVKKSQTALLGPYGALDSPAGNRNPQGISGGTPAALMFTPPQADKRTTLRPDKKIDIKPVLQPAVEIKRRVYPRKHLYLPQQKKPQVTNLVLMEPIKPVASQVAAARRSVERRNERNRLDDPQKPGAIRVDAEQPGDPPRKPRRKRTPL